jgi:hypothetical protein
MWVWRVRVGVGGCASGQECPRKPAMAADADRPTRQGSWLQGPSPECVYGPRLWGFVSVRRTSIYQAQCTRSGVQHGSCSAGQGQLTGRTAPAAAAADAAAGRLQWEEKMCGVPGSCAVLSRGCQQTTPRQTTNGPG